MLYENTEDALRSMLLENTGKHFLDSGGDSGRAWQRNRVDDPTLHEPVTLDASRYGKHADLLVTVNVYHWLLDRLELAPELDDMFQAFAACETRQDEHDLSHMEDFATLLDARGIYGDGDSFTVNTYNGECHLSQTLQFQYMHLDSGVYVALQIHGGADVRGGYTSPTVFEVSDKHDETSILDYARAYLGFTDCDASWSTDNAGYTWYSDCNSPDINDATKYVDDDVIGERNQEWQEGEIYISDAGLPHCPECNSLLVGGA